jgi:hypothetical protein
MYYNYRVHFMQTFLALALLLVLLPSDVFSDSLIGEKCHESPQVLGETVGNASTWDNLRNNEGSLRFETEKLLTQGLNILVPAISLKMTSIPRKYKQKYRNEEYCKAKYEETIKNPLTYPNKKFSSSEDLNEWISDFSQGKGDDGENLYLKCDRDCSPQYSYLIIKKGADLLVDAYAVCGHARDKNDNTFLLGLSCEPVK